MKLIYSILIRLSLALLIVLTVWTVFFYFTMIDEINDEVDDALEDYSETIIIRSLAGKELPSKNDGTNNSYSIRPITREEAGQYPAIEYYDAAWSQDGGYYCADFMMNGYEKNVDRKSVV